VALDRGELERLYGEYRQQLFTCALAITCSPARAEDAVHDAFCRMLRRRRAVDDAAAVDLKAYVFRAVRNAAVDQLRRRGPPPPPKPPFVFFQRPRSA
jgi:RNA polymerase sigma-70 factor (ECF subfamily)